MPPPVRDPKSIITPDAFSVTPSLLGTPLARPSRRLWALLIDVMAVSFITAVTSDLLVAVFTSGFWVVIGVVIAAFALRKASRKSTRDDRRSTVFRLFLGCAGVSVLTVTISIFLVLRWVERGGREEVAAFVERLEEGGVAVGDSERPATDPGSDSVEDAFATITESLADDRAGVGALKAIRDSITDLNDELQDSREERDRALEGGGFTSWVTGKLDNIGFGLGWWAMYFAILMPLMKGQTLGKRALGIRVLRLDGNPVTLWHAFERAGGYAAGFATGMLGFAQVYWDANRQAIHDKIAGTVVVRDGAPKVEGLWDAPEQNT